jgi:hypothetical protein
MIGFPFIHLHIDCRLLPSAVDNHDSRKPQRKNEPGDATSPGLTDLRIDSLPVGCAGLFERSTTYEKVLLISEGRQTASAPTANIGASTKPEYNAGCADKPVMVSLKRMCHVRPER